MRPVIGAAPAVLQSITDAACPRRSVPVRHVTGVDLGCGFVRATRVAYVGELG